MHTTNNTQQQTRASNKQQHTTNKTENNKQQTVITNKQKQTSRFTHTQQATHSKPQTIRNNTP